MVDEQANATNAQPNVAENQISDAVSINVNDPQGVNEEDAAAINQLSTETAASDPNNTSTAGGTITPESSPVSVTNDEPTQPMRQPVSMELGVAYPNR